jgi:hypothetical protein
MWEERPRLAIGLAGNADEISRRLAVELLLPRDPPTKSSSRNVIAWCENESDRISMYNNVY